MRKYVWIVLSKDSNIYEEISPLFTKAQKQERLRNFKNLVAEATIAATIFVIHKSFTEGNKAAIDAVDTFEELGIDGFNIGNQYFSGRNENVMRGELLANTLLESIDSAELRNLIQDSTYLSEILDHYRGYAWEQ